MNKTPNWKSLDLNNKCGSCNYYKAFIKNKVLSARGTCTLKTVYKMRTESCLKYEQQKQGWQISEKHEEKKIGYLVSEII
jgi:hypothetical protein